jgi:hypothetical protein
MKPKTMFRVVQVSPDGGPELIVKQSTLQGAALVMRLIQRSSPLMDLRIEWGPDNELADHSEGPLDKLLL